MCKWSVLYHNISHHEAMTDTAICIMKMMARMHTEYSLVFCREDDISDIHKVAT